MSILLTIVLLSQSFGLLNIRLAIIDVCIDCSLFNGDTMYNKTNVQLNLFQLTHWKCNTLFLKFYNLLVIIYLLKKKILLVKINTIKQNFFK